MEQAKSEIKIFILDPIFKKEDLFDRLIKYINSLEKSSEYGDGKFFELRIGSKNSESIRKIFSTRNVINSGQNFIKDQLILEKENNEIIQKRKLKTKIFVLDPVFENKDLLNELINKATCPFEKATRWNTFFSLRIGKNESPEVARIYSERSTLQTLQEIIELKIDLESKLKDLKEESKLMEKISS